MNKTYTIDTSANKIYTMYINGMHYEKQYDNNDNLVFCKNSIFTQIWEYDKNKNITHTKVTYPHFTFEIWYEYDENNNLVLTKDSNGFTITCKYDANNNLIYKHESYSDNGVFTYEYDDKNNLIKQILTYFENGEKVANTWNYIYENGRLVSKESEYNIVLYTYNSNGKLLAKQDKEKRTNYTYNRNGTLKLKVITNLKDCSIYTEYYNYNSPEDDNFINIIPSKNNYDITSIIKCGDIYHTTTRHGYGCYYRRPDDFYLYDYDRGSNTITIEEFDSNGNSIKYTDYPIE